MSYQVFARKYRPKTFADVLGQEHVVRTLENAIKQERLAQAYLFVGPRGTGKTSTARIFAKALNCPHVVDAVPCNQCEVCDGISSGSDFNTGWSGVYSDGDISVTATSQYGSAYAEGIFSNANSAWITTGTGSSLITSATGEDWSRTTGLFANANDGSASVYNEGLLTVSASTTGYGDSFATGIRGNADLGDVWITNEGVVTATAAVAYSNFYSTARGIDADTFDGNITINKRPLEDYFPNATHRMILAEPLRLTETGEAYDIDATLHGGGVIGAA